MFFQIFIFYKTIFKDKTKPKLKLLFDNGSSKIKINLIKYNREISEQEEVISNETNLIGNSGVSAAFANLNSMSSSFAALGNLGSALTQERSPLEISAIKEIEEEFKPIKFILRNVGDIIANDIVVHFDIPEEVSIIKNIPSRNTGYMTTLTSFNSQAPTFGIIFDRNNYLQLWVNRLQHPFTKSFKDFYINVEESKKIKIPYTINAVELPANSIKGTLVIEISVEEKVKYYDSEEKRDSFLGAKKRLLRKSETLGYYLNDEED